MSAPAIAEPNDGRRDLRRAVAELGERLPDALLPLAAVAYNYHWSWLLSGADVFREIDPTLWRRSGCNPRWIIETVAPHRLRQLAGDAAYAGRVEQLAERTDVELACPVATIAGLAADRPVAYFCSEFGVHCSLPLYGGGLGVLAGDMLKAASDLALPMVGVGLLYRQGYFRQRLDLSGWQVEYWTTTEIERLPMVLVTGSDGVPLTVEIMIRGRTVRIQIWRVDLGRVPLYLLDTDRHDNHPIDRWITARLYIGDRHTRLAQYAVLGLGGIRALDALGIRPQLVHLNEGHAALGSLERLRLLTLQGLSFDEALAAVRERTVFTTHTPVAAGNEWYTTEEVEPVLGTFVDRLGIPRTMFFDLGRFTPGDEREPVSITPLALRTSRASNGVSRRHGEVARGMWQRLWPGRPVDQVPIGTVTNGVHTATWMADAMQALLDRHLGPEWRDRLDEPALWERISAIPDDELWQLRRTLRTRLVEFVREHSIVDRLSRGEAPGYVEAAARVFDPDVLTIGFARRIATYKRLSLLTRQLDRALALLANPSRPMQLIIAGKAHPADGEAKQTLRTLMEVRGAAHVAEQSAFLEDYDLHMAPSIVAGVDLWLNLPRPPLEASGTSGMKVALNGGLNLSVLDGWWLEGHDGTNGWAIATPDAEPAVQDDHDTTAMLDLLEQEIIPLFYDRGADGLPHRWLERVKRSMQGLIPRFSAARMLREYAVQMYAPARPGPAGEGFVR
ncbi:MAG TPA: alpha-glucan family phosphorylase [Candidatus Bathyarchaeia archaeon]|nr:alpha-glucan family phosphorylase [Candidatus Bathyarchaeia archaeon]